MMTDKATTTTKDRKPWIAPRLERLGAIRDIAGPNPTGTQGANFKS
jgi:uncharacterized Fe-S cluster protein YjdI